MIFPLASTLTILSERHDIYELRMSITEVFAKSSLEQADSLALSLMWIKHSRVILNGAHSLKKSVSNYIIKEYLQT